MTAPTTTALTFATGIAPFPAHTAFTLDAVTDGAPLFHLRSTDPSGPQFVAIDPVAYFPDYRPEVPADAVADLALTGENAAVLALVSIPGTGAADATANLLAPLVVNKDTGAAAQVVLTDDATYPVKARLRR
jgi:flagellar assembly factor FliW